MKNSKKYKFITEISSIAEEKNDFKALKKINELSKKDSIPHRYNIIHSPKTIVWYLQKFTENTTIKFTTHFWDSLDKQFKSYKNFIESLNEEFQYYKFYKLPQYNSDLYFNLIFPFLFQNKTMKTKNGKEKKFEWGTYKLKIGWQFPPNLLNQWCENNPNKTPYSMEVPKNLLPESKIDGKQLLYFEDFVEIFKKEIEFRRNDLYYAIKKLTREVDPNFDFDFELIDLKGLSFYTQTSKIKSAIRKILRNCSKDMSNKIIISGKYDEIGKTVIIEIIHKNSYSDLPIDSNKLNLKNQGQLNEIKKDLWSLCDWSIESRFRENNNYKFYRFNYLNSDTKPYRKEIDQTEGFKHILKFYTDIDESDFIN
jgi:hypothetical protein